MDQSQDDGTPVGDSQTISSTGVPIVEGAHQKYSHLMLKVYVGLDMTMFDV